MKTDYKAAGVDVEAGYRAVELMRASVRETFRKEVLTDLGGFGGLFSIARAKEMDHPVLVSGTDGVGTKLKIAFLMDKHDTIGIDCVAMCVNDIVCSGAEPLFFLDYIACGKNYPEKIAAIVKGVAEGCRLAGASLIGGETAEMPGFYAANDYDLAGFAVGLLDQAKRISGELIQSGDVLVGIASSGIHSNGYSLVRKVLRLSEANIRNHIQSLGTTLGEALLQPTKIYVQPVLDLIGVVPVKGISHITGGGFIENIPRMLPKGRKAIIRRGAWPVPPIFDLIAAEGELDAMDLYNTFNMGIGMVLAVAPVDADNAVERLRRFGEAAYVIGEVTDGEGIELC